MDSGSATSCGGQGKGPKVRVCYLCGRGYGLSSYEIHLKQCKAMWEATQAKLPVAERKPLPKEPGADGQLLGGKASSSLDAQNEAATQVFNTQALEGCEFCGRTFLKERLKIHLKSCTPSSPAARVGAARLSSNTGGKPSKKTSRCTTTRPEGASGTPTEESGSTTAGQDKSEVQDDTPAGNYGGIGRRISRRANGVQGTPPSSREQSTIELMEKRLLQVEQQLVDTKDEVDDLRKIVRELSLKMS